jgi:ATP-dependent DNA helicase PIF1
MSPLAKARVKRTEVLIIDECSLLNGQLLDKVDKVVRMVWEDDRVFGGIKLVIVGGFCQLEPFIIYVKD